MGNLIKMDLRRMLKSTLLKVSLIIIAIINIFVYGVLPIILKMIPNIPKSAPEELCDVLSSPFSLSILSILLFMSAVSFFYADFANGFVKNLAGQVPKRSNLLVSKFVVIGIHNLIFITVGALTELAGLLLGSALGVTFRVSGFVFAAVLTLLIKWMLCMGLCAILMFVTTGVRSKTLASIVGVIIGTGTLAFVYMGLTTAIATIFKININVSDYMPDQLFNSVNVGSNVAVVNAIIVSIVCSVIFLALSVKTFNSKDIK